MNTLSWLLYFAEVSSNIGAFASFMLGTSAIVAVVLTLIILCNDSHSMPDHFNKHGPRLRNIATAVFMFSTLGFLFPSQNTVYLIIASETADTIVTSESGQKMIGDIQNIVSLKLDRIANDIGCGQHCKPDPTDGR